MCGILAVAGEGAGPGEDGPISKSQALDRLSHRGPDSRGIWSDPSERIWLGHRRLAIVDLTPAGNQPMADESDRLRLTCNGEIYNAPTLRKKLISLGHTFRSRSDNEVILHGYQAWGEGVVDYLEGMFAFVLWDRDQKKLIAARDRVGIKPLYVAETSRGVILASELSALLPLLKSPPSPDPLAIAHLLTLSYVPAPSSIWQGVRKLSPGSIYTWQIGQGGRERTYWQPPRDLDGGSSRGEEWAERFHGVLGEHLLSDVPVALFLSGGLDSSSVAVGLREQNHPMEAFTIGFPESRRNEAGVAAATAHYLDFPHHVVDLTSRHVTGLLHQVAQGVDEPDGHSSQIAMFRISEAAAGRFKVVLAGDGGDELFGGYNWYQNLDGGVRQASQYLRRGLRPLVGWQGAPALTRQAARHFSQSSPLHRHAWRLFPRFLPEEVQSLLAPMGLVFDDERMLAPLKRHFEPRLPLKRALQRMDLMTFCADHVLTKVDRASMAHSLEVRVPLLDHRLIEWAYALPEEKNGHGPSKPLLRRYLRDRTPPRLQNHPKQGFSARALDRFDWEEALAVVRRGVWVREGYWQKGWERLLAPGVPERHSRIWTLLMLTLWGDKWLGEGYRGW
ncbi:MAG: asparagine synthase (glutamine-hydrolyzing) [Magnetococcales bacterium]|nr:asparagine synthase (glutamine-hydrolyzing) [Magnetococcales bacterium]